MRKAVSTKCRAYVEALAISSTAGRHWSAQVCDIIRANIVPFSMREHNSSPPSGQPDATIPPVLPASDMAKAADAACSQPIQADESTEGRFPPPSDGGALSRLLDEKWPRRMLWVFIGLAVMMIGAAAIMMVRVLQDEHALRNVARATLNPTAVRGAMPVDGPAASPPSMAGAMPSSGEGQYPAANSATVPLPASATGGASNIAPVPSPYGNPASGPQPMPPAQKEMAAIGEESPGGRGGTADATGEAGKQGGVADDHEGNGRERARATSTARTQAHARRNTAAQAAGSDETPRRASVEKRAARPDDTFRRCPPLGAKGAVTCRVHICNGGAGKERACRPYLEHRP
ncbi:MAG TPA: hypothetical protein VF774_15190 [Pseudoduganella sp.]